MLKAFKLLPDDADTTEADLIIDYLDNDDQRVHIIKDAMRGRTVYVVDVDTNRRVQKIIDWLKGPKD